MNEWLHFKCTRVGWQSQKKRLGPSFFILYTVTLRKYKIFFRNTSFSISTHCICERLQLRCFPLRVGGVYIRVARVSFAHSAIKSEKKNGEFWFLKWKIVQNCWFWFMIFFHLVVLTNPINCFVFIEYCVLYYICYKGISMGFVIVLGSVGHSGCVFISKNLNRVDR